MFIMRNRDGIIRNRININRCRRRYRKCLQKSRCTPSKLSENLERIAFPQYTIVFMTNRTRCIKKRNSISPFLSKLEIAGVGWQDLTPLISQSTGRSVTMPISSEILFPSISILKIPHPHKCKAIRVPGTTTGARGVVRGTWSETAL